MATKKKASGKKQAPKKAKSTPKAKAKAKPTRKAPSRKTSSKPKATRPAKARPDTAMTIARKILELGSSSGEAEILALYAPDAESIEMSMPPTVGLEALRAKFQAWGAMVSSAKFVPSNVWVAGNTILIEWRGECVLAGSGKHVELREVAIHEVENGKIKRERYYYDPAALQP